MVGSFSLFNNLGTAAWQHCYVD